MRKIALFAAIGLLAPWTQPAAANFEYRAERFAVSGQVTYTDEFDDDVLAPWTNVLGTASESGGQLRLESPGDASDVLELLGGPTLSISNARAPAAAAVTDGGGDFSAEARWEGLPGLGGTYSLQFFAARLSLDATCIDLATAAGEGVALEAVAVSVSVRNFDPVVPPFSGPTGLAASAVSTRSCLAGIASSLDNRVVELTAIDHVAVDPATVTGDVVVRLDFADAGNSLTPAFSVDGGSVFTSMSSYAFDDFSGAAGRFQLRAQPLEPVSTGDLPVEGEMIIAIGPLPRIRIPTGPTTSLNVGQGTLGIEEGVWSTSGPAVDTSLFTGVPLLSSFSLGQFSQTPITWTTQPVPTDAARNQALTVQTQAAIPNPVGPGSISGAIGYGGLEATILLQYAELVSWQWRLHKLGAENATTTTWSLCCTTLNEPIGPISTFATVTMGPWVTAPVSVTGVKSTMVDMPGRTPPEVGVIVTLDPMPGETVRRLLNSAWTTPSGFHPPFTYETSWRAWTFAQTVSGMPGTHGPGVALATSGMLELAESVVLPGGGVDTSNITQGSGSVSLVAPMRIITTGPFATLSWPRTGGWAGFGRLTLTFVPEPDALVLLAVGVAALALMGWRKSRH